MILKQKLYGRIEIDNKEKDTVAIWNMGSSEGKDNNEINVNHIDRKNIKKIITMLQECEYVYSLKSRKK
jgi:predicted type IV restriction endonuclease